MRLTFLRKEFTSSLRRYRPTIRFFFEKGINSHYIHLKVEKSFINNKEKIGMMYHFPETEKMTYINHAKKKQDLELSLDNGIDKWHHPYVKW